MALIKQIVSDKGIPMSYHRIYEIIKTETNLEIVLMSYVSKAYREQANENFVMMKHYTFNTYPLELSFSSLYNLLKEQPDFIGAEDD